MTELPYSEACERNKWPIGEALLRMLPPDAKVLEVGAGTGQHAVHFSALLPEMRWLATDLEQNLPGLRARFAQEAPDRLAAPLALDVGEGRWPAGPFDAVYTANTLHIMPFDLTPLLLAGARRCLRPGGLLICYGPFMDDGQHHAESNRRFDESLQARDPSMGIRDTADIVHMAKAESFSLDADLPLPANNRLLVFSLAL